MTAQTVHHQILGSDMQVVEITLVPGETVIAEAGSMLYLEDGIVFEARMGDGSGVDQGILGSLWGAAKRAVTGAGIFMTHFTNHAHEPRRVIFGANNPGKVLPIHLNQCGGQILCEHHSFLCATQGTQVNAAFTQRFGAGLFGGAGFVLQKLSGDGTVFLHACGSVITEKLQGQTIRVEPGSLVGFTGDIEYSIERAGNLKTMFLGGEGLFLATLRGTGTVILQSLPWSRVVWQIIEQVPRDRS